MMLIANYIQKGMDFSEALSAEPVLVAEKFFALVVLLIFLGIFYAKMQHDRQQKNESRW